MLLPSKISLYPLLAPPDARELGLTKLYDLKSLHDAHVEYEVVEFRATHGLRQEICNLVDIGDILAMIDIALRLSILYGAGLQGPALQGSLKLLDAFQNPSQSHILRLLNLSGICYKLAMELSHLALQITVPLLEFVDLWTSC